MYLVTSGTDSISLLIFFLLLLLLLLLLAAAAAVFSSSWIDLPPQKGPRLRRFKSDRDDIWLGLFFNG